MSTCSILWFSFSTIVTADRKKFNRRLLDYLLALPVIAIVNNVIRYSVGELKIQLRSNLTNRIYQEYLEKFIYYRLTNLDSRIINADQLLTADVDKFCECVTELYCNIIKPILDIAIYVYKININLGLVSTGLMASYLVFSGALLTYIRKPIGKLTSTEQKLEGEFRHINSRIITYSEEIAFYVGNEKEKITATSSFEKLMKHLRKIVRFQALLGIVDNIVTKYLAVSVGFVAMAVPYFYNRNDLKEKSLKERAQLYYVYGTMMLRLGNAIGRLTLAGREVSKLAGYTVRVAELHRVIEDLRKGNYERSFLSGTRKLNFNAGKLIFKHRLIKFDKVPIITPSGDVLIRQISLEITAGLNVLVCGPNGAGKSSLFRILGELWPLFGGELTKPPRGKLFYIPQKPYMTLGSLRDQIAYPHGGAEAARRGVTDNILKGYLKNVKLEYLLEREGGFDAVADWLEILSGGEKQRIAMARLFYHQPEFAILDECTSAVSLDMEESMYNLCKSIGITLLTVSHRKSLWKHHEYVLHLDGRGNYSFKPIEVGLEQFGS